MLKRKAYEHVFQSAQMSYLFDPISSTSYVTSENSSQNQRAQIASAINSLGRTAQLHEENNESCARNERKRKR